MQKQKEGEKEMKARVWQFKTNKRKEEASQSKAT